MASVAPELALTAEEDVIEVGPGHASTALLCSVRLPSPVRLKKAAARPSRPRQPGKGVSAEEKAQRLAARRKASSAPKKSRKSASTLPLQTAPLPPPLAANLAREAESARRAHAALDGFMDQALADVEAADEKFRSACAAADEVQPDPATAAPGPGELQSTRPGAVDSIDADWSAIDAEFEKQTRQREQARHIAAEIGLRAENERLKKALEAERAKHRLEMDALAARTTHAPPPPSPVAGPSAVAFDFGKIQAEQQATLERLARVEAALTAATAKPVLDTPSPRRRIEVATTPPPAPRAVVSPPRTSKPSVAVIGADLFKLLGREGNIVTPRAKNMGVRATAEAIAEIPERLEGRHIAGAALCLTEEWVDRQTDPIPAAATLVDALYDLIEELDIRVVILPIIPTKRDREERSYETLTRQRQRLSEVYNAIVRAVVDTTYMTVIPADFKWKFSPDEIPRLIPTVARKLATRIEAVLEPRPHQGDLWRRQTCGRNTLSLSPPPTPTTPPPRGRKREVEDSPPPAPRKRARRSPSPEFEAVWLNRGRDGYPPALTSRPHRRY